MGAGSIAKLRIPSRTRIITALLNITLNNKTCTKYNNFFQNEIILINVKRCFSTLNMTVYNRLRPTAIAVGRIFHSIFQTCHIQLVIGELVRRMELVKVLFCLLFGQPNILFFGKCEKLLCRLCPFCLCNEFLFMGFLLFYSFTSSMLRYSMPDLSATRANTSSVFCIYPFLK